MIILCALYQNSLRTIVFFFKLVSHSFGSCFFAFLWVHLSGDYCYQQYNYTLSLSPSLSLSFFSSVSLSLLLLFFFTLQTEFKRFIEKKELLNNCSLRAPIVSDSVFASSSFSSSFSISTTCGAAASSSLSNSFGSPAVQSKNCISCFSFFFRI